MGADGSTLSLRAPLLEVGAEKSLQRPELVFIDAHFNKAAEHRQISDRIQRRIFLDRAEEPLTESAVDLGNVSISFCELDHFPIGSLPLAREKKLATQMGNQGSSEPGLRRAVEVIHSGVIGAAKELHVWSNRPVWRQGYDRPTGEDPIPANLDWDCWLGPAAVRPFKKDIYHTFQWRGWYEFGTGALGDMACHTVNMPFRALKMGYPTKIECEIMSRNYSETFPLTSRIRFEFPEREGLPPFTFWWYDGNPSEKNMSPLRPDAGSAKEIISMMGKLPPSGALIIGEKGKVFSPDDYGAQFYVALKGEEDFVSGDKHEACKSVPQTIPRSPGHMQEFVNMIKDFNNPAYSNFEIAGYLAEVILLGCVALRVGEGRPVDWDGPAMKSPSLPEAAQFTIRNNRKGWEA